jgi:hypothetical protein
MIYANYSNRGVIWVHQNNIKKRKTIEELLCKKPYYCKPITGLKISCKPILGRDT